MKKRNERIKMNVMKKYVEKKGRKKDWIMIMKRWGRGRERKRERERKGEKRREKEKEKRKKKGNRK